MARTSSQVWLFTFINRRFPISESFTVSKSKSKSKSKSGHSGPKPGPKPEKKILCLVHGCGVRFTRKQECRRHVLESHHLPYPIYCHNPGCRWQGIRNQDLYDHITQAQCGPKPELEEQRMVYDVKLVLGWIRDGFPIDQVRMFAVDLAEERARELGKEGLWAPIEHSKRSCY